LGIGLRLNWQAQMARRREALSSRLLRGVLLGANGAELLCGHGVRAALRNWRPFWTSIGFGLSGNYFWLTYWVNVPG